MNSIFKKWSNESWTWDNITNIQEGRENLGEEMPVYLYRLLQFTIKDELIESFGKEKAIEVFRNAGKKAGIQFAENRLNLNLEFNEFVAHLQQIIEHDKIGVLRIEAFDPETGHAILTVSEDVDCSGLPVTGETVCNYDEGFLAGILNMYTKQNYEVIEVDCWSTGARVCRFDANIK